MDSKGRMQAKEYYLGISDDEKKRLRWIVKHIADSPLGTHLPKTMYNLEDAENKIYAFKPHDHRFFNFMTIGRKIIILDAFRKHSQEMTRKDLNILKTAVLAKQNYLNRVREGTYYER